MSAVGAARRGSGRPLARDVSSSGPTSSGIKLKADPTLPSGQQRVVDGTGKKLGLVKKVGGAFMCSADNYQKKYPAASACLSAFK